MTLLQITVSRGSNKNKKLGIVYSKKGMSPDLGIKKKRNKKRKVKSNGGVFTRGL